MGVIVLTESTAKRKVIIRIIMFVEGIATNGRLDSVYFFNANFSSPFRSDDSLEFFAANVNIFPYIRELRERTEDASLQLVEVMIEVVGALCKLRFLRVDCKLNLSNEAIIEFYIDEDIVCLGS
jgi:hypothetical protein